MTAYELVEKVYLHYMGTFMRHLWTTEERGTTPKDYIRQSFNEMLEEYTVDCDGSGIILTCDDGVDNAADKRLRNIARLQATEVFKGYWLCHYDINTGDWYLSHYIFQDEAIEIRKAWGVYLPLRLDWFWIVKID